MASKVDKIFSSIPKNKIDSKVIKKNNTEHLLIRGDCLEVMRYLPDRSI